jgi:hypothetical protein
MTAGLAAGSAGPPVPVAGAAGPVLVAGAVAPVLVAGAVAPVLVAGAAGPGGGAYDADIIVLSLDRTEDTLAAVASACAQEGVSAHVFVLDQGSAAEGLARLAAGIGDCGGVTLLAAGRNLGVAGGRNLLSGLGRGRVIVALDNDAVFGGADTVARIVAALDAEPGLAAVGCRIVRYGDGRDDLLSWGYPRALLACAGEAFDAVTFVGAGHGIRRAAWEQAGGYDAALGFCWEEFDFCLRAIALGWRVRYRGDIVVRHRVAAERRLDWAGSRWFYFVRNRLYVERKAGAGWLVLLPRACGYLLKGWRNGMGRQSVLAVVAAWRMGGARAERGLTAEAAGYLRRNDRAHRGGWVNRLTHEVLAELASPGGGAGAGGGR